MRLSSAVVITVLMLAAEICLAQGSSASGGADEKGLWEIWKAQQEKPEDHAALNASYLEFVGKQPKDQLAPVAMTLAAWHLLKMNNNAAAVKLLKLTIDPKKTDALSIAAENISKTWLTRVDLEQVKQALQLYYRKKIEYPKKLEQIIPFQKDGQPPLNDRFGKPWVYGLAEFKNLKKMGALYGMYGQQYYISSVYLGTNSELKAALKTTYGSGIGLKPVKMISGAPGKEMAQFESTDGKQAKAVLSVRSDSSGGDGSLNYVGPKLLILSDKNHWMIVPRPY